MAMAEHTDDVPQAEKDRSTLPPQSDVSNPTFNAVFEEKQNIDPDEKIPIDQKEEASFKEQSTLVSDLPENEKKALQGLKNLIQEALKNHAFTALSSPPPPPPPCSAQVVEEEQKQSPAEEKEKPDEEVIVSEVIEEKLAVEDDGAKTVEAIEETIIAVPPPAAAPTEDTTAPPPDAETPKIEQNPDEVSIWGIPLLADQRTDTVLLKFLRARDFKVKDAFTMISNTIRWRKEFKIDELIEQEEQEEEGQNRGLHKAVFMYGSDKEGHPVCYNVYGEFQDKQLYQETFSDEEKRERFLKWRVRFLEKSIRKLDFSHGGACTIVQVNDLKNSPGPGKWELRQATKQALNLFQDNYPEFVAKVVFINVPWWYLAVNRLISPFLTQRTKSKFVFAGPSKSTETLLRYIAPEELPVKYGGLSKSGEFESSDCVNEVTLKPGAKHTIELPVSERSSVLWEVKVVGWGVSYGAEFVPSEEGSYTVIIEKLKKLASTHQQQLCSNNFKAGESGKVVLSIHNPTSKKKKLLYRFKTDSTSFDHDKK